MSHQRQKKNYDKKIHGDAIEEGDLVWLHTTVIPRGKSKKLHHLWTAAGPYRVISQVSESDYGIKLPHSKKAPVVVHFNRLKLCSPTTRLAETSTAVKRAVSTIPPFQQPIGAELEIVEDSDIKSDHDEPVQRRYPSRSRQPPEHYADTVHH